MILCVSISNKTAVLRRPVDVVSSTPARHHVNKSCADRPLLISVIFINWSKILCHACLLALCVIIKVNHKDVQLALQLFNMVIPKVFDMFALLSPGHFTTAS